LEEIIEALRSEALLRETDPKLLVNGHGEEWLISRIQDLLKNCPATMVVALNKKTRFCGLNKKLNHMGINCFTFNSNGDSMLFASYDADRTMAAASFIIDSTPQEEE
jgi:hypothetical protein